MHVLKYVMWWLKNATIKEPMATMGTQLVESTPQGCPRTSTSSVQGLLTRDCFRDHTTIRISWVLKL